MSFMPYVAPEQLMKDRSEYAHKGIARGRSVVGLEYADGLLFLAENPSRDPAQDQRDLRPDRVRRRRQVQRVRGPPDRRHPAGRHARVPVRARGREGAGPRQRVLAGALDHLHAADEAVRGGDPGGGGRRRDAGTALYHILFDGASPTSTATSPWAATRRSSPTRCGTGTSEGWDLRDRGPRGGRRRSGHAETARSRPTEIEAGVLDRTRAQRRKFRRLDADEVAASWPAEPPRPASSSDRAVGCRRGPAHLRARERVRRDVHVPWAAPALARRGRPIPVPPGRALGPVLERLPGERRPALPRRRLAPRVRDARVRRRPRARRARQGGGADPRTAARRGRDAPPRGGHLRATSTCSRTTPTRPATPTAATRTTWSPGTASSPGWPTC